MDGTENDLLWQDEGEAEVILSGKCSPKLKFLIENSWSSYAPSYLVCQYHGTFEIQTHIT
jgi:hypothetical protein